MTGIEPGGGGNPGCEPAATSPTPPPPEPNTPERQERERRADFPAHLRAPPSGVALCHGCYRPADRGPDVEIDAEAWQLIAPPPGTWLCVICMHERLVAAGVPEGTVQARITRGPLAETTRRMPAELDEDLAEILGTPNFACIRTAGVLRAGGRAIPTRAESEQAFVIHWLLTLYLAHGAGWRTAAAAHLDTLIASLKPGDPDG